MLAHLTSGWHVGIAIVTVTTLAGRLFSEKAGGFKTAGSGENPLQDHRGTSTGHTGAKTKQKTLVIEDKWRQDLMRPLLRIEAYLRACHALSGHVFSMISSSSYPGLHCGGGRAHLFTLQGVIEIGTLSVFMFLCAWHDGAVMDLFRAISDLITVQVNGSVSPDLMETQSDVRDTPEVIEAVCDSFQA